MQSWRSNRWRYCQGTLPEVWTNESSIGWELEKLSFVFCGWRQIELLHYGMDSRLPVRLSLLPTFSPGVWHLNASNQLLQSEFQTLKKLEDHVANLSNPGDTGEADEPVPAIDNANNEAAIFGDILTDPDMQELEPTSPLISFETLECENSFVSNDSSSTELKNLNLDLPDPEFAEMNSTLKVDSLSAEKKTLGDNHQQSCEDDPSFLPLFVLRQQVLGRIPHCSCHLSQLLWQMNWVGEESDKILQPQKLIWACQSSMSRLSDCRV